MPRPRPPPPQVCMLLCVSFERACMRGCPALPCLLPVLSSSDDQRPRLMRRAPTPNCRHSTAQHITWRGRASGAHAFHPVPAREVKHAGTAPAMHVHGMPMPMCKCATLLARACRMPQSACMRPAHCHALPAVRAATQPTRRLRPACMHGWRSEQC